MPLPPNGYFIAPTSGNTLFLNVVIYDSSPFDCHLKSEDSGPYTRTPSDLVFVPREFCRPLRLITAFALDACHIKMEIEEFVNGPGVDNLSGQIDPVKLVNNRSRGEREHIATLCFDTAESAGDYLWTSCIDFHIAVFSQINVKLIQSVRFSSTAIPFWRSTPFQRFHPESVPKLAVYGAGYIPGTDTGNDALPVIQNAPIVARPITGNADTERGTFHALTNALYHLSMKPVSSFSGNTNEQNTNIGFYRNPLLFTA